MAYQPQPVREQAEGEAAGLTLCPNCRAAMPGQMRFCRLCGYRLGEGVAEYAETVRFASQPSGPQRAATAERRGYGTASPFYGTQGGGLAQSTAGVVQKTNALAQGASCAGQRKWPHWIIWPILAIFLSVLSEVDQRLHKNSQPKARPAAVKTGTDIPPPPALPEIEEQAVIGAEQLKDAAGGASFEFVTPGSAADKAGLVGGDIINSFDGKRVGSAEELMELLRRTPAGKTVSVAYTRDGQSFETRMRTLSEAENEEIQARAEEARAGAGFMGQWTDSQEVHVPFVNINGVRLGEIRTNNPAARAGLRKGDIVTGFDDVPIRTRGEFESRMGRAVPGSTVRLSIVRGAGERLEIPIRVGREE